MSIEFLTGNDAGVSVVHDAFFPRVYYVHSFRVDFVYTISRREAALSNQTPVSTNVRYIALTWKHILWRGWLAVGQAERLVFLHFPKFIQQLLNHQWYAELCRSGAGISGKQKATKQPGSRLFPDVCPICFNLGNNVVILWCWMPGWGGYLAQFCLLFNSSNCRNLLCKNIFFVFWPVYYNIFRRYCGKVCVRFSLIFFFFGCLEICVGGPFILDVVSRRLSRSLLASFRFWLEFWKTMTLFDFFSRQISQIMSVDF